MIGQLQKNFSKRLTSTALYMALLSTSAYAADIDGPDQITASTSMPILGNFTIEKIADGIAEGPVGYNGFTTSEYKGVITLDFDQTYNLDGFKLWNDVMLRAEGIKTFRLDFKTEDGGGILSSQILEAAPRQPDVQIFKFPKVHNVTSVDLVVLSSLNEPATATELPTFLERIEVRELAFTGQASGDTATQIAALEDYIDDLNQIINDQKDEIEAQELRIEDLSTLLTKEKNRADTTFALLQKRDGTIEDQNKEIENLEAELIKVKKGPTTGPSNIAIFGGGVGLLGLGGLLGWLTARRKRRQKQKYEPGFLFSGSHMLAGPLPSTLAHCQPIYDAVGRIGYAQNGKPQGDDKTFGTGILIAPNKILTNHHVFDMAEDKLTNDFDTGIEFFGERDSDKSDFVRIDKTVPPVPLKGFDALIFTLTQDVEHRNPVELIDRPAEELKDLDVVVIGYPYKQFPDNDVREATREDDPIMGVKRYSEGNIFDHSYGRDKPYGVEAPVRPYIHRRRKIRAICHNASTLFGNSGSAVICKESGKLIALHFGYDPEFEGEEATNFAIPGEDIAEEISKNISKTVTPVTDDNSPVMEIST